LRNKHFFVLASRKGSQKGAGKGSILPSNSIFTTAVYTCEKPKRIGKTAKLQGLPNWGKLTFLER